MAQKISGNHAVGDGCSIFVLGVWQILYMEGRKHAFMSTELMDGSEIDLGIEPKSLVGWNPPFSKAAMTDSDKKRILENTMSLLGVLGIRGSILGSIV